MLLKPLENAPGFLVYLRTSLITDHCSLITEAERGMYIFMSDGHIDDLEAVKRYTIQLAKDIAAGKHNFIKCVLIGVGKKVDENQIVAFLVFSDQ
ncbi:MAG: hypothetical protein DRR08_07275 [Candidatus Parabeggiatoa sp. nov. 2]|nr:MAG: hypothetical protein B6247_10900 [Beggiatoa sp. 4572_84]RKZ61987.1 MAG: hypothetical protein DRR08_07275 [Gammaproteobacteria bacterium]